MSEPAATPTRISEQGQADMLGQPYSPARLLTDRGSNPAARGVRSGVDEAGARLGAGQGSRVVYSLVVVVPLFHNPDISGRRCPIEKGKLKRTKAEIKAWFGGYTSHRVNGWYRNGLTGVESTDRSIVFSIDAPPEKLDVDRLREWKGSLEARFAQECIYITLAGPVLRI
jgi:hypothetical protein